MKKLFFTAIAVVAFSSVSVAGTKDLNKEKQNSKKTEKKLHPCVGVGFAASDAVYANGGSGQQAAAAATAAYAACLIAFGG